MTNAAENGPGSGVRLGSQARLILSVSLRRLAPRAEEIRHALRRYSLANAADFVDAIGGSAGVEGLAVLAALPAEARPGVLSDFDLGDQDRAALAQVCELLGDAKDSAAPAAALVRMYPEAVQVGRDLERDPDPSAGQKEPASGAEDTVTIESLAAMIAAWEDERAAVEALERLAPAVLKHGSPLPAPFWVRAAERLQASQHSSRWSLIFTIADILFRQGETQAALRLLESLAAHFEQASEDSALALTQVRIADVLARQARFDDALALYERALRHAEASKDDRGRALVRGRIADVLQGRGELDEALRIRREEELPVYEHLGDERARAMTLGKIADALQARGELDEALHIRREEELPVYERLGDERSRAVTLGRIAEVLEARGELDEALRIRREEELPVFERLGVARERAVTLGRIADVLEARGELDEALRIRREHQLPAFELLGDVGGSSVTKAQIAQGLRKRNQADDQRQARALLAEAAAAAGRVRIPEAAVMARIQEMWDRDRPPRSAEKPTMSASAVFAELAYKTGLSKKQVAQFFEELTNLVKRELGKKGPGVINVVPGMIQLKRRRLPAARAKKVPHPSRPGEERIVPAKPARDVVMPRALKNLKDMIK